MADFFLQTGTNVGCWWPTLALLAVYWQYIQCGIWSDQHWHSTTVDCSSENAFPMSL